MTPAYKTNIGASKQAYAMINGKSLRFVGFHIGNGGFRNGQVLTVNRSDVLLNEKIAEFDINNMSLEIVDGVSIRINCNVPEASISSDYISNIGIIAEVAGEEGTFLYCISNFKQTPVFGDLVFSLTINN